VMNVEVREEEFKDLLNSLFTRKDFMDTLEEITKKEPEKGNISK
jgi:hypothetical protein